MRRVVITGIGAVTPLGNTFRSSWEALCRGESGIGPALQLNTTKLPWKVWGELKHADFSAFLSSKEIRRLDLFIRYAVAAAAMAADDAGLTEPEAASADSPVMRGSSSYLSSGGAVIGSSRGGISTMEQAFSRSRLAASSRPYRSSPYLMPSTTIGMAASYTAKKLGLRGYGLGISNACSSGASAIGEAYRLIRCGFDGPLLAGGTDAPLCITSIEGYGAAGALSKIPDQSASRPFEKDRDGFVPAEGACIVMLEEYQAALSRGAGIYAEIIGYGNSVDAFHQTRPLPEGEAEAIMKALSSAGIGLDMPDMISCHATSTPVGDMAECRAIHQVFGKRAGDIPVTALKSATGHMLAASGAFEVAATALAIQKGMIPPTQNLHQQDPNIDLSVVTETTSADITVALTHSFGFGGMNAVIALRRVD